MSSEARRGAGVDEGFFISVRDYLIVVFRSFLFIFSVFILCRSLSFEYGAFYHCLLAAVQIENVRIAGYGRKSFRADDGVVPEQESCRTLGVEHRVVECSERVILYADVLVYRAFGIDDFVGRMYGDHSMAGASIIGTVYKGIAFDQYIFDRSRFVPAFGVGLNQYGAHARLVIRIVLYHHLSWSGDQSSSCTGSCEVAVTYFHFGVQVMFSTQS